jgi:hypothetical protein
VLPCLKIAKQQEKAKINYTNCSKLPNHIEGNKINERNDIKAPKYRRIEPKQFNRKICKRTDKKPVYDIKSIKRVKKIGDIINP